MTGFSRGNEFLPKPWLSIGRVASGNRGRDGGTILPACVKSLAAKCMHTIDMTANDTNAFECHQYAIQVNGTNA